MLPTFTLPKGRLVGFALSAPGVTPVPDTAIVSVGFAAFEETVTVPLTLPLAVGVNVTVKVALLDAATVAGVEMPLIANTAPLTDT